MVEKVRKPGRPVSIKIDTSEPYCDMSIFISESLKNNIKLLAKKLKTTPSALIIVMLNMRLRSGVHTLTLKKSKNKEQFSRFHIYCPLRIKSDLEHISDSFEISVKLLFNVLLEECTDSVFSQMNNEKFEAHEGDSIDKDDEYTDVDNKYIDYDEENGEIWSIMN
ncbi:hypothetical protein SDC9_96741 [bioreactor metagenome]|uniref:Uncharacterized protein n=1 Tax=bioreactor metagenome TaxID=1076179 RepID=A0A645AAH3_9ZZZZ